MPNVPERKQRAADVAAAHAAPEESADSPTTVIEVDERSPDGRRVYQGKFMFKVPTLGDRADIAALKSRYLQELSNVPTEGDVVAEMLSYLSVTLDNANAPEWWKKSKSGTELYDYAPVVALYGRCREYEAKFLGGDTESGSDAGEDPQGTDAPADSGVDADVQPPAERRQVVATLGKGSRRTSAAGAGVGSGGNGTEDDEAAATGSPV